MSHTYCAEAKEREENKAIYIDLAAFANDILQGDMEWFERIAERELQKLGATVQTIRA